MSEIKKTLKISGMHCASCGMTIERALKDTKGIKQANVNIANEKLILSENGG